MAATRAHNRGPRLHNVQGRLTPLGVKTLRELVAAVQATRRGRYGITDYVSDAVKRCMAIDCERYGVECRLFSSGMDNSLQPGVEYSTLLDKVVE